MLLIMRKLIVRVLLIGAATTGIVAACYDRVPPRIVKMNAQFGPEQQPAPAPPPTSMPIDAGVSDVVDLPPVPDASGLDAPTIKNAPR